MKITMFKNLVHNGICLLKIPAFLVLLGPFSMALAQPMPTSETFETHAGWFQILGQDSRSERTFRKYVAHKNGFKNALNLHCPPGDQSEPYVSVDLGMSEFGTEAIKQVSTNPSAFAFTIDNVDKWVPGVTTQGSVIYYQRISNGPWIFDEALTRSEFSFIITYQNGSKLVVKIAKHVESVDIADKFYRRAKGHFEEQGFMLKQLSTYEVIQLC